MFDFPNLRFFGTKRNSNLDDVDRLLAIQRKLKHIPLLSNPNTGQSQADCSFVKLGMDDLTPQYHSIYHAYVCNNRSIVQCMLVKSPPDTC